MTDNAPRMTAQDDELVALTVDDALTLFHRVDVAYPDKLSPDALLAILNAMQDAHAAGRASAADRLAAQAQEIAELREELAAAKMGEPEDMVRALQPLAAWVATLNPQLEKAEAALAEARKDAERWRVIRAAYWGVEYDKYNIWQATTPEELDAAIDSARTAIARGEVSTPPASA